MSNGAEHTPPAGTVAPWALERDCHSRHMRTNDVATRAKEVAYESRRRLDALAGGVDGSKGRVGELESNMEKVSHILERVEQSLGTVQRSQEKQGLKVAIVWGASALVSSAIAVAAIRLMFGGG